MKNKNIISGRKSDLRLACGCSALALMAAVSWSSSAHAQAKIEQMIVTATKRAQDVQSVPASISAFSGAGLAERQINDVENLTRATPNITLQTQSGAIPTLAIRGVSTDAFNPLPDGAVALHVDGVYQPRTGSLAQTMFDLENIEILRGPQGTLYGRNANAGVINFNTAKPTDTFEGSATLFGGSYGRYGAKGYISGPVADGVSMRLSAMVDRSEGFIKNLANGHDIGGMNLHGARLSIRLKPTDDVTVDLSTSYAFTKSTSPMSMGSDPYKGNLSPSNYNYLVSIGQDTRYAMDSRHIYQTYDPNNWTKQHLTTAIITWDINPDMTLKSITGYQGLGLWFRQDYDGMIANGIDSVESGDSHTVSQEFNLSAKLWDRVDFVAGLFYLHDVAHGHNKFALPYGNPFGIFLVGLYGEYMQDQTTTSYAAFTDITVAITDDFRLVGGVRRTFDYRDTVQNNNLSGGTLHLDHALLYNKGTVVFGCGYNHHVPALDYKSTTGKVGLQYDFTPDVTAYVSWQNGFKDGGYNPAVCDDSFAPEKIESWEAGLKGTYFDGSLSLNLAVFDYKYTNMQVSRVEGVTGSIDNAGSSKIRGFEVEAVAYVTDDLRLDMGLGYLDTKYGPLFSVNQTPPPGTALVNLTGGTLPRSPKVSLNLGAEYTTELGSLGELKMRGEYSYTSKYYLTIFAEEIAKQDGYSLFNAFVTFTPEACPNLSLQVYGRNLANKAYRNGGYASATFNNSMVNWALPRTFGAELTAKF